MNFINLSIKNFIIPDFVPIPSTETMQTIGIISLIVGICLVGVGLLFQFLYKGNFLKQGKENKTTILWILIGVGVLLIVNHSIQLLF